MSPLSGVFTATQPPSLPLTSNGIGGLLNYAQRSPTSLQAGGLTVAQTVTFGTSTTIAMSSYYSGGGAATAMNDGVQIADFPSIGHSNGNEPYGDWAVIDLGAPTIVQNVSFFNRGGGCCAGRADLFDVTIGDVGFVGGNNGAA